MFGVRVKTSGIHLVLGVRALTKAVFYRPGISQPQVEWMWRPELRDATESIGVITGPAVLRRVLYHPRPYRIQFNVTQSEQKIATLLHNTGYKSTLKQGTRALIGLIEIAHVVAARILYAL
jgi:hypothetical protein